MPNHVTNILELHGARSQILDLLDRCSLNYAGEQVAFSFCGLVKPPGGLYEKPELHPGELRGGEPGWYNWNCENWGTKWDAYSVHVDAPEVPALTQIASVTQDEELEVRAVVRFDTAW